MPRAVNSSKVVAERLRVIAMVVEKIRAAVPTGRGRPPFAVIGPFATEHEEMVQAVIEALGPWIEPTRVEIVDHYRSPRTTRVILAEWPVGG